MNTQDEILNLLDHDVIKDLIASLDNIINDQLAAVVHHDQFKHLEATWLGLFDLISGTNFDANVMIEILDVSKEELQEDFDTHSEDFFKTALFQKIYVSVYHRFDGKPFGSIIGLYEFENTPSDLNWLKMMSKIAHASLAPFISSVKHQFFDCNYIEEYVAIEDLEDHMNRPEYTHFNDIRTSEEAAYLGLCFPRYMLRLPWNPVTNPCRNVNFTEYTWSDEHETWGERHNKYLWGNPAILFAKILIHSFQASGWCRYITGRKDGLVTGLPVHKFFIHEEQVTFPVEIFFGKYGYGELELSQCGFIPLCGLRGTEAVFFSAQSVKRPKRLKDSPDSAYAYMACHLPDIYSAARFGHYARCIFRDHIGISIDATYVENLLNNWISNYVTTEINVDDRTLQRYPFKAAKVEVHETPGQNRYYNCKISVLPHHQIIEGFDLELRLQTRLSRLEA